MKQNNMLAMILAGGRGTRLLELTKKNAKPAVYFGGKYRIIDFPLSNCANSDINVVGVLTQYESVELNAYAGAGQRWGLDARGSGVYVLPPREKDGTKFDVYQGTADAITQNIDFIDKFDPEYVLILSGDHIYKMDYSKMIAFHKEQDAACTIAVYEVPMEEAPRFGILNTNPDGSIYEFDEKPAVPKSNKASMGIYVFTWSKLRDYLIADEKDPSSSNDFGKNVLPTMLNAGERMFAYRFEGYWKDVGTIDSLWESNMDMLHPKAGLDLSREDWKIYSRNPVVPPQYIAKGAKVQNSLVAEGCNVYGDLEFSILFEGVYVAPGAEVLDSIVMPGAVIEEGAKVRYAIVAENAVVGKNAVIGMRPEDMEKREDWGVAVVGPDCKIPEGAVVAPKEMIEAEEVQA